MSETIVMDREDVREGMRLLRAQRISLDALHMAENEYKIWVAQMAALYAAPAGYVLRDIVNGFEGDRHGD
jgi:hypothetical protein